MRQYEPFFTDTHRFEFDVRAGVSPIMFYDPLGRVVATLHPDHTWEKVVFTPWRQERWDVNDTILIDPREDEDVGAFFRRLPEEEYLPTWHALRTDPAHADAFAARYPDAADRAAETLAARRTEVHAGTPTVTHADSLGRAFLTIAHNRFRHGDAPAGAPPQEAFHATRVVFDITGNQRAVIDAKGRVVMRYDYHMGGPEEDEEGNRRDIHRVHQASMEAGARWTLTDVAGNPVRAWDSRGFARRMTYDALRRPVDVYVAEDGVERLVARTEYGESLAAPEATNHRTRVHRHFDQAGVVVSEAYDFKGNPLKSVRRIARDYRNTLDWAADVPLEEGAFVSSARHDALNRPVETTAPDGSVMRPAYNEAGLLERLEGTLSGATEATAFIASIDYDAKGRRERIVYGNGAVTTYEYDPRTFRLTRLRTIRNGGEALQDLRYTYDPAGNIIRIRDEAQQTVFFRNRRVDPQADYTYDAIYRLIEATGREHLGQAGGAPIPHSYNDAPRVGLLHPGDGNAMGRYLERYIYDEVGNFLEMQHRGSDPAHPGWTRTYAYDEASQLEPGKQSNRLSRTTLGDTIETYSTAGEGYDAHGNMLRMPHLQVMQWDFNDQLRMTQRQTVNAGDADGVAHRGERTWYVYDATGQRVRKVTERADGRIRHERVYLDGFEVYRRYGRNPLVRETLHVMGGEQRVALVETRTQGEGAEPRRLVRYQLGNHLGSVALELDEAAQIISYEEYTPYGSTSYQAVREGIEAPKRYRYTGMERDEESGLNYHTARYYAPWLGRWTSCDPAKEREYDNGYIYSFLNPLILTDKNGKNPSFLEDTSNTFIGYFSGVARV